LTHHGRVSSSNPGGSCSHSSSSGSSFFTRRDNVEEDLATVSRMTIPATVDHRAGGGYGAERAVERPSDDELRVADLA
jgi:hypothetical protein